MALPSFTIAATSGLFEVTGLTAGGELHPSALEYARVTFLSNIPEDRMVTYQGKLYRVRKRVVAGVSDDGSIVIDDDPVQLLANDDELNVDNITYTVEIVLPAPGGGSSQMRSWDFVAPSDGSVLDLSTTVGGITEPTPPGGGGIDGGSL